MPLIRAADLLASLDSLQEALADVGGWAEADQPGLLREIAGLLDDLEGKVGSLIELRDEALSSDDPDSEG